MYTSVPLQFIYSYTYIYIHIFISYTFHVLLPSLYLSCINNINMLLIITFAFMRIHISHTFTVMYASHTYVSLLCITRICFHYALHYLSYTYIMGQVLENTANRYFESTTNMQYIYHISYTCIYLYVFTVGEP